MVKQVVFFKRKPGMTVEAFQEYWRTTHADIIVRLPGIRRYVQSHTLLSGYKKGEPAYDGVAEVCFDDTQAMKTLAESPEYADVLADEPNFIDASSNGSIITDEHVIKAGPIPQNGIKSIDFINRKTAMSSDDFFRYWLEEHGALCAAAEPMRRYVQNHTRRSIYDSGRTPLYDGVAMIWFDDTQALRAAAATPEFERLRADVGNFIAQDKSSFLLTREHVILP
jgi:uncharacterized protein (TIGR02118 family)